MGKSIPIFRGEEMEEEAYFQKNPHPYHGQDGLGDLKERTDREMDTAKTPGSV